MSFYYNPYAKEGKYEQLNNYWQTQEYINEIAQISENLNAKILYQINNSHDSHKSALISGVNCICGSIDNLKNVISRDINRLTDTVEGKFDELITFLDYKLNILIEQQKIANNYLGLISQWIQVSDRQKGRIELIQEGLSYLNKALLEGRNSPRFNNAHKYFIEALKEKDDDFFVNHKLGFIYFWSESHRDIKKAYDCYYKCADILSVYVSSGGTTISNIQLEPSKQLAFLYDTYYRASECCYWLSDEDNKYLELAIKMMDSVLGFDSTQWKATLLKSKYLVRRGDDLKSKNLIDHLIMHYPDAWKAILDDEDLSGSDIVLLQIEDSSLKLNTNLKNKLNELLLETDDRFESFRFLQELIKKVYLKTLSNNYEVEKAMHEDMTWKKIRVKIIEETIPGRFYTTAIPTVSEDGKNTFNLSKQVEAESLIKNKIFDDTKKSINRLFEKSLVEKQKEVVYNTNASLIISGIMLIVYMIFLQSGFAILMVVIISPILLIAIFNFRKSKKEIKLIQLAREESLSKLDKIRFY